MAALPRWVTATCGQQRLRPVILLIPLSLLLAVGRPGGAAVELRLPFPAYGVGGVTMVPLRPVAEWLGADIRQSPGVVGITLSRDGRRRELEVRVGSASALVDGRLVRLPRKAASARGEVVVPLDLFPLAFGVKHSRAAGAPGVLLRDGNREALVAVMRPRYPIVVADGNYLLGGLADGKWADADTMAPQLPGGERYWVYSLTRFLGTALGTGPKEEMPGPYQSIDLSPKPKESDRAVAVGGPWDALPRKPVILSPSSKLYQQAVRDVLRENGLPKATVRITRAVRIDLEGDGTDEVILSAKAPGIDRAMPYTRANDYSLVVLRKVVRGRVQTHLLGAGFYKAAIEPSAPYFYELNSVLDLDGDGALEILVADEYYEGMGMVVHQMRAGKPVAVLSGGFGA